MSNIRVRHIAVAFGVAFALSTPTALAATDSNLTGILSSIQTAETGGESNPLGSTSTTSSAIGEFQITKAALVQEGYMDSSGNWTAASGVTSTSQFLSCESCQVAAETGNLQQDWSQLQSNGAVSQYLGQTVDGVTYNESALLECAQEAGPAGCNNFLAAGGGTAAAEQYMHNAHAESDIAAASETSSAAITGSYTAVNNSAAAAGGSVSSGTALAQMQTYCASEVSALMASVGQQEITDAAALATSTNTGYTMMNGGSVMSAINNPSALFMDPMSSTGMMQLSCIDNLMNGNGLSGIFTLPTLQQLLNMLKNAVCQAAAQQMAQLMAPVSSELGQVTNMAQGGGFFPGLSLSSLGGTFAVGTGGGGLSMNGSQQASVSSILNQDNSWYASPSSPTSTTTTYYPGLFQ